MLKRSKIDDGFDDDDAGIGGSSTILVVNDDHDSCELIARLVEAGGWRAQRCYDPDDAAKTLDRPMASFAAVIADLAGGISADLEVVDTVRGQPTPRGSVPVIVLSSRAEDDGPAWRAGADGVLIRPFHANDLLGELQSALGRTADERAALRATRASGTAV